VTACHRRAEDGCCAILLTTCYLFLSSCSFFSYGGGKTEEEERGDRGRQRTIRERRRIQVSRPHIADDVEEQYAAEVKTLTKRVESGARRSRVT
jgi:hypothetical protein